MVTITFDLAYSLLIGVVGAVWAFFYCGMVGVVADWVAGSEASYLQLGAEFIFFPVLLPARLIGYIVAKCNGR